jgi:hypothetical protein
MAVRKNINRGYMKLIVWQDAKSYYDVEAGQVTAAQFDELDAVAYKLENGAKRLVESLQEKQISGEWQDTFVVRESNAAYGEPADE